ncbi:MAG: CBS domain-containing protein [Cyclobacteriaceae bacterium]|nr:CBS domain-containing protein [Cyclobacteriaceae bacterium]
MGLKTVSIISNSKDKERFVKYLLNDIKALEHMIEHDMIESGIVRIGAEQELCLVDEHWRPAPIILDILPLIKDERFTTELAKFNLEINLDPLPFEKNCLSVLQSNLLKNIKKVETALKNVNAKVLLTGILPTIRNKDLNISNMTPLERYHALANSLSKLRNGMFEFHISGTDELITTHDTVMFESCNTSFQLHFQVSAAEFVDHYNWAQMISGPVLAASTNSPLLLGKRLWRETRIALFQQSIDIRQSKDHLREQSSRVSFGSRWIHDSIADAFKEDIIRFDTLLSNDEKTNSMKLLEEGKIPSLDALLVHNSTIYKWNRPCYGVFNGKPHLRIENRYLASGPTLPDQVANAAFWFGLMSAMPKEYRHLADKFEFDAAKTNFLKAARDGLDNKFMWMDDKKYAAQELILQILLPMARQGLINAHIDKPDIDHYLGLVEERVNLGKTGSQWMIDSYNNLRKTGTRDQALVATTAAIYHRQQEMKPIAQWNLATIDEAGNFLNYYLHIDQIMTTDIVTVKEDDLIDLVANIMDWKQVREIPVENEKGDLVGLMTAGLLVNFLCKSDKEKKQNSRIRDLMNKNPVWVSPETSISDSVATMIEKKTSCLLVVDDKKLVGMVTDRHFVKVSAKLLRDLK